MLAYIPYMDPMGYDKITTYHHLSSVFNNLLIQGSWYLGNKLYTNMAFFMSPISIPRADFRENLQTSNKKQTIFGFSPQAKKKHTHIVSGTLW